jgi:hypothetical protein
MARRPLLTKGQRVTVELIGRRRTRETVRGTVERDTGAAVRLAVPIMKTVGKACGPDLRGFCIEDQQVRTEIRVIPWRRIHSVVVQKERS